MLRKNCKSKLGLDLIILHKGVEQYALFNFMRSENSNIQIKQELVNSIIHGFGIIFGVVSIPILIALAIKSENMAGGAAYGFVFFNFHFSTLYHGIQHTQAKHTLEILDHISIYFLIAGTYTPFTYVYAKFFWHYVAIGFVGPHH
jgi:predicted membrane channel-forming protein YqfA (hemolysin III family)